MEARCFRARHHTPHDDRLLVILGEDATNQLICTHAKRYRSTASKNLDVDSIDT